MSNIPLFKVSMSKKAKKLVGEVLDSGYIGQGPKVEEFETKFHELVGTKGRPLMVNSCTSAITLALVMAGVGPGDEVITTPMTCSATNTPILHVGGTPVWADINPITGLICPEDVARKITPKTKAIIAVDWCGRHCDYEALKSHGIPVIQDAAHCLYVGDSIGDYVCWSFQAIKFLTTADGGALLVPEAQYEKAKLMRWFGLDRTKGESFRCSQDIQYAGYKFQPNDVMAAMGLCNFPLAIKWTKAAKRNAAYYNRVLKGISGLTTPPKDDNCSFWLYTMLVPGKRDELIKFLADRGIASSPVHSRNDKHSVFSDYRDNNLPGVDYFASSEIAIPVGVWVTKEDRERIVQAIHDFFGVPYGEEK